MRKRTLLTTALGAMLAISAGSLEVSAQAMAAAEPFKVGTFAIDGVPTVGLVLRDDLIVDINRANRALELNPRYTQIPMPEDMLELVGQYEYGLKYRLYEIVNYLVDGNMLNGSMRPDYVHPVSSVDIMAPIQYPGKIMNAAVNFYTHACEGCTEEELQARTRERQENRGVPYLFLKPARGAVIGDGDEIMIPWGRDRTDWEVEMGLVIGKPAKNVAARDAYDYVFGYMVTIDVSDRGGRPPGGFGSGSDWFVGKGHDTFAPQGPWIVPKEFYGDPMERLHQQLVIDGVQVQEAHAGDMIHSIPELIEYASSLITLFPGDVLNSGTSGGTSSGAFETGSRAGYLEPGESIEASIEGIGTLHHTVVAEPEPEGDFAGSRLPPVDTYRD
ncbi:MAG: fumarylacetoacetate hydrolase family protein [Gemmatimonadota bacterium]